MEGSFVSVYNLVLRTSFVKAICSAFWVLSLFDYSAQDLMREFYRLVLSFSLFSFFCFFVPSLFSQPIYITFLPSHLLPLDSSPLPVPVLLLWGAAHTITGVCGCAMSRRGLLPGEAASSNPNGASALLCSYI